jgi:hypothetical protein
MPAPSDGTKLPVGVTEHLLAYEASVVRTAQGQQFTRGCALEEQALAGLIIEYVPQVSQRYKEHGPAQGR